MMEKSCGASLWLWLGLDPPAKPYLMISVYFHCEVSMPLVTGQNHSICCSYAGFELDKALEKIK
jgi:hypothetical protein